MIIIINTVVNIIILLHQVNIDDGLLDEVFEDLPGNSQAKSQPAPRSPSKVACFFIMIIQMTIMIIITTMVIIIHMILPGFWVLWWLLLLCDGGFQSGGSCLRDNRSRWCFNIS